MTDLGAWASEQYRIPEKPEDESEAKDESGGE